MTAATTPARHASLPARASAELGRRLGPYAGRLGWDAGQLAAHQRERLRELLGHAAEQSPFHARRLRGIDPGRFEAGDLARTRTCGLARRRRAVLISPHPREIIAPQMTTYRLGRSRGVSVS
jgi:hypothetical protein